jgi:hypothetical protein
MVASRSVQLWPCAVGWLALACASAQAPVETPLGATREAEAPRIWPRAAARAEASERIVVLEAPRSRAVAARVVKGFFDAVRHESIRDLDALLSADATLEAGPGTVPEPVSKVWSARFKRLDYAFNGAKAAYRPDDVGVFTAEDVMALGQVRRFELVPGPRELLAVVSTRDRLRGAGPRHFGRRIEFVLAEGPSGLAIRRVFEDFRLP